MSTELPQNGRVVRHAPVLSTIESNGNYDTETRNS